MLINLLKKHTFCTYAYAYNSVQTFTTFLPNKHRNKQKKKKVIYSSIWFCSRIEIKIVRNLNMTNHLHLQKKNNLMSKYFTDRFTGWLPEEITTPYMGGKIFRSLQQCCTPFLCSWPEVSTKLLSDARTFITVPKITFEKHLPLKNVSFFWDQIRLLHHLIKDNKFNFRDTLCAAASYFCPI